MISDLIYLLVVAVIFILSVAMVGFFIEILPPKYQRALIKKVFGINIK